MKPYPILARSLLLAVGVACGAVTAHGQERGAVTASGLRPQAVDTTDVNCEKCHADFGFLSGKTASAAGDSALLVTQAVHDGSVHGEADIACLDCHADFAGYPHVADAAPVDCGACHEEIQRDFVESLHGYALAREDPAAPSCVTCHGLHDMKSSLEPASPTASANVPHLCASCHGEAGLLTGQLVRLPQTFTAFAASVHGRSCGEDGACCTDCHSVHALRGPLDPESNINRLNVAATCGSCHDETAAEYERSIHARALSAGLGDSPTCTDCHGEHLILSSADPDAPTYAARLAAETCGTCHNDPVIIEKYSLPGGVVGSYADSYHGWTAVRGFERAATCVSCHGAHAVLPEADSASTIHASNVVATCQQCHAGADRTFAASYTHVTASEEANPINRWLKRIYLALITVVIGGMLLHNAVVLNYYMIEQRRKELREAYVVRFDGIQLAQHLINALAFIALVITGFALRHPEAWWVGWLGNVGMTEPVRSGAHRVAAVVLVVVGASHVWYVLANRRGREEFRAILPRWSDVKDAIKNVRFHLWRADEPPRPGRYDYTQKAEYWALIWGTVVMAITGFVLWFPVGATRFLPWWVVPASQVVHYYEAWLATLAILVWHFFFVIFHPDAYPMNWAWLTGRLSEDFVEHHHPRWHEELTAPKVDERMVEAQEEPRSAG